MTFCASQRLPISDIRLVSTGAVALVVADRLLVPVMRSPVTSVLSEILPAPLSPVLCSPMNKRKPVAPADIQLDGRGRRWEKFTDMGNFDMQTIRCLDVPDGLDFNSAMNFSFIRDTDASAFWEMIPRLS